MNQILVQEMANIACDVFNTIGSGYNEVIYHKAFEVALRLKGINYQSEVITPIFYKSHNVGHGRVDILIGNNLIIELKAISNFNSDTANIQIKNYMKHFSISEGIVINFGQPNKNNTGELNIRYIYKDVNNNNHRVYNYINGSFVESNEMVIL